MQTVLEVEQKVLQKSESGMYALREMRAFSSFYAHSVGSRISKTTTSG